MPAGRVSIGLGEQVADLGEQRDLGVVGLLDLTALEHCPEQLRLHRNPVDLTFSACAALNRIDAVSWTAVPGLPAIFLPSRSAGVRMPALLRVMKASGVVSKLT